MTEAHADAPQFDDDRLMQQARSMAEDRLLCNVTRYADWLCSLSPAWPEEIHIPPMPQQASDIRLLAERAADRAVLAMSLYPNVLVAGVACAELRERYMRANEAFIAQEEAEILAELKDDKP